MPLVSVEDSDDTPAPLCCVSPSAALEPGLWMPRVPGADVQAADGALVVAKCAVITDCTAAVISSPASAASPAVATACATDALGSGCPRVILWTSGCF